MLTPEEMRLVTEIVRDPKRLRRISEAYLEWVSERAEADARR
ncbi:MAG TPA: hypothetical protein VI997_04435 [Candidatus Thermoplasmatota archaeon]|nr:hypothetical protein [Candidatus Thermoplasmatota archaeon]